MIIPKKIKPLRKESKCLLYVILALALFAITGQIACDQLGSLKGGAQYWFTIVITFSEIAALYVVVRFLSGRGRIAQIFLWILGALAFLYMLLLSILFLFATPSSVETYGTGWWISQVDKLEEEQRLWSLSHWVGHGDPYYEYDDTIIEIPAKTEVQAMEEPYCSALDERAHAETTYRYYYSDTMLNILSYLYGRWVWLTYLAIAIIWIAVGIRTSFLIDSFSKKLLYFASWLLITVVIWLPALNGCGLRFSYYGPPFTGFSSAYWEYNLLMIGPPLGVMLSLAIQKNDSENDCCKLPAAGLEKIMHFICK